ncbi:MAG TPA: chromosome segregation protein SMC [Candidatus Lumbricidophila sp.]|nr:chromosome segregation protein SMC [Candidatus Lumbricidophila sp.]
MYLKSLTLKGFKSFAQPTTFAFEPGVTCIVGPNGSGKSNVVDALAWVMGEQGAKTLRGGKMEDVIFAGTSTRGPLGRAEVSLTIDNADGALPIAYTEVTISRTLFRSGQSEYAINGEGCRLLDVQELLSDSGLGREMHVIVGQGRLDSVLHASPEERRGFIEEAAGILKHRRRKEKTLRKLDAMQANLTRLTDLAAELRRQLKPLGRQAEVAREAAGIAAVVRDAKARLLADDIVTIRQELAAFGSTERERHSERTLLQTQVDAYQATLARLEAETSDADVDAARATTHALEQAQAELRALDHLVQQRIALLSGDVELVDIAPTVTPESVAAETAGLDELREQVDAAARVLDAAHDVAARARVALDEVDHEISQQSALVSAYDQERHRVTNRVDTATSHLTAAQAEVARHTAAVTAAVARRDAALAERAEAEAEASADETQTGLDVAYEQAQATLAEAETAAERTRERLHELEREQGALAARTQALGLALDQRDGSAALVAANLDGVAGLVAEHLKVQPGYEAAIAAALGSAAEAVLVTDRDAALNAVAHATKHDLGRVDLALAHPHAAPTTTHAPLPGLVPAATVVEAPAGVLGLLHDIAIADDLDAVQAAGAALAERGTTVITRDGTVIGRFVVRGGSGRKQSRIELIAERDAAAAQLDAVRAELDAVRTALAEQRTAVESGRAQAKQALAELRAFDAQLASRSERLNRARAQAEAADAESERLRQAATLAAERVTAAEAQAAEASAAAAAHAAIARPVLDVTARDAAFAVLERAREDEVNARLGVEAAAAAVRAGEARVAELERQLAHERAAAAEAARRATLRRGQLAAASRVALALPPVLASAEASVAEARELQAAAVAARQARSEELASIRRDEDLLRARLHSITEDVHGLELRIHEKKIQVNSLIERSESELSLEEAVLVAEYGPDIPVPSDDPDGEPSAYDRDATKRRLAVAERKLGELGRVNPLALEEFAALEQRHTFLNEQLADLANTRRDLLQIVDDLDHKLESIFASAFEDTRDAFAEVFPVLFPGGTGSISLTDPDNMLTTGIEVSVRPAGKKIERLSLLSGGERSLAAVALLMAIFKARPSPFYIMDEVEAALDDANLGRLLQTMESLRADSQLIVITHQKRTMEIADALYGVSMRQDGVSAVVGQRVREAQPA